MKEILVTGAAGFIGAFLCRKLMEDSDYHVVGADNLNDYYDPSIKRDRLNMVKGADRSGRFEFIRGDISDSAFLEGVFEAHSFDMVVNLAAQAGVRYSIENPSAYIESNLVGFFNVLEMCRNYPVKHLVFASSSSVYGLNEKVPYAVSDKTDSPVSLYAATKKSNELMAHAYSKLYGIPCTGLRFFTVYGPMGRPDMAYFKFADKIVKGEPIQIFNRGDLQRDFTYIDDIVEGVVNVMQRPPLRDEQDVPFKVYNIGNSRPEPLMRFVDVLEEALIAEGVVEKATEHEFLPMQPGDVYKTYADVSELEKDFGFRPSTSLEDGLREFARWYNLYRKH
ncbi:NAD-dependent epimerase/dehydratase family protein [Adlercreutzia caecimuris]|uniref:NAD-dependent epimerase/dehydratase family protein n=1 Tax=Adlercreutzia caecimuris TaxID=671266 RepID=UPI0025887430|nr:NAD-dependent epimerase/dehydratase family protein [Adlercreutzia caecimuris]